MCVATIHLTQAKSMSCGICWSYMTADSFLRRGNNYQMLHTPHAEKYSVRSFPWAFSPINKSLIFMFVTLLSKSTLPRKKKPLPNLTLSAIHCLYRSLFIHAFQYFCSLVKKATTKKLKRRVRKEACLIKLSHVEKLRWRQPLRRRWPQPSRDWLFCCLAMVTDARITC